MNYHGTWIHAGNYGRILLVGDIFANSMVAGLQREIDRPVDVVYADTAGKLIELATSQMERLSYGMVIIVAGDISGDAAPGKMLAHLRGRNAKTSFALATTPPAWLKSAKYRNGTDKSAQLNEQYRQCAAEQNLPCLDYNAIAQQYHLQSPEEATWPVRFFSGLELKRFHFSKIKKVKREGGTPEGRARLTMRFLAYKTAEFIKEQLGNAPQGDVLWNNFQAEEGAPYLLVGDSNMRRIRSMNKELRSKSDIYSTSEGLLSDAALENIRRSIKPHHQAIAISYGTHHLSAFYSEHFEQQCRKLFTALKARHLAVVTINVTQRATEHKPYRSDAAQNEIIAELNKRFDAVAREHDIPCIDAYSLMAAGQFEDKVHYRFEDYTELADALLLQLQTSCQLHSLPCNPSGGEHLTNIRHHSASPCKFQSFAI